MKNTTTTTKQSAALRAERLINELNEPDFDLVPVETQQEIINALYRAASVAGMDVDHDCSGWYTN